MLLAMDRYFNTFESITPDFVARMWLGDTYVAEHAHQGRTTDTLQNRRAHGFSWSSPARRISSSPRRRRPPLLSPGPALRPDRPGARPVGYGLRRAAHLRGRSTMRPTCGWTRRVSGTSRPARVRIRLTMVAVNRRYHVALVDRLPAGLEIINPDLAVSERAVRPQRHVDDRLVLVVVGSVVRPSEPARCRRRGLHALSCGMASTTTATSPVRRRPASSSCRRPRPRRCTRRVFGRSASDA